MRSIVVERTSRSGWLDARLARAIPRRVLAGILAGGCFLTLLVLALIALSRSDLLDDAYITARYAQNLAHGYGWVWNPGTAPTDGTTAPLWTLILTSIIALHLPIVHGAIALNAVAFAVAGTAGCTLAYRVGGLVGTAISLVAMATFAALVPGSAGMETTLYESLLILGLLAWHEERFNTALACAALLPLVRGDGALLLAVLCLDAILQRRLRTMLPAIGLALLPAIGWEAFSWWQFHALLPNSFLAKHALSSGVGGKVTPLSFLKGPWGSIGSVWVWVSVGVGAIVARRAAGIRAGAIWLIAYIVFYAFLAHVPEQQWYLAPAWWVTPAILGAGIGVVCQALIRPGIRPAPHSAIPIALAALALSSLVPVLRQITPIAAAAPSVHRQAGDWLSRQPRGLIAAAEIGTIGYYSGDPVVDVLGLVSPEVVPHMARGDYSWAIRNERPRYVFIWTLSRSGTCSFEVTCNIWASRLFRRDYKLAWQASGQDYGIFARR